ncbi:MAG: geranylgeranylglyceryl/heptaprenylglyceryl phosphate synthase [Candidatus Diapherotrites archaeon]|nr:geranylgeranylglyceryl/heptaprenylglyceryl phosphate synthase [Candidatus Diapherotrites archaeon]
MRAFKYLFAPGFLVEVFWVNYASYFGSRHVGKTYAKILKGLDSDGALTFMQLDPPNYSAELAGKIARVAEDNGLDAFAVGGSVGAQGQVLDDTILAIKENSSLPVILFPGNIATLSPHADAMYFMSMLNSLDPYFLSGAQIAASFPVKKMGLEAIPTAYIIVEPGRAVGWVGRAQLVPRSVPYIAAITALAGQYMGSHLVILESGGGADSPAPKEMVVAARQVLDVPLLVAGGVRTKEFAFETVKAGADIVQIGTAFENAKGDLKKLGATFRELTSVVKRAGKERQ